MTCHVCQRSVDPQQKFCGECGARLAFSFGNTVQTGAGGVSGGIYQAGRDVIVNPASNAPPKATYEVEPKWRSPFTQAVLSWLGLVLALLGVFPSWKGFVQPVFEFASNFPDVAMLDLECFKWSIVLMLVIFDILIVLFLHRLTKLQLRWPLFRVRGWAISGTDHRVTLEKIHANPCPKCGGKMCYYNKVVEWINHTDKDGKTRREVTKRIPVLECKRNPEHCFKVDPAEII